MWNALVLIQVLFKITVIPYLYSFLLKFKVNGVWKDAEHCVDVIDGLNGEAFLKVPDTKVIFIYRHSELNF